MKIAIHQPEHFPYMGFFEKMKTSDIFVILDDVQYKKNNWQNRNKFINKNGVEEFFGVQVEKNAHKKLIRDVKITNGVWRIKTLKKLKHHFSLDVSDIYNHQNLLKINMESIKWGMKKLKITTPLIYSSELDIKSSKTDRLIDICKSLNAITYISGKGGKAYLDESKFTDIKLEYLEPIITNYNSIIAQ
tara:strand:- start:619 stop:1185 length:567 start_codon:yes stop_codon:yes gene_type:complete